MGAGAFRRGELVKVDAAPLADGVALDPALEVGVIHAAPVAWAVGAKQNSRATNKRRSLARSTAWWMVPRICWWDCGAFRHRVQRPSRADGTCGGLFSSR